MTDLNSTFAVIIGRFQDFIAALEEGNNTILFNYNFVICRIACNFSVYNMSYITPVAEMICELYLNDDWGWTILNDWILPVVSELIEFYFA